MTSRQPTVDEVTTTNTISVWRDKLNREERSKHEWHHRWGESFGQSSVPPSYVPPATFQGAAPDLPRRGPQYVEPTASALKYDPALYRGSVPLRAPSVSSKGSAVTLPSMSAVSVSSSADRRRELLIERQSELQAQLALVEQMLQQAKPTTYLSTMTGASGYTNASGASVATAASAATAHSAASRQSHLSASARSAVSSLPERRG